jgi:hypothetical protein
MKTGNEDHYIITMVEDWGNEDCDITMVKTIYLSLPESIFDDVRINVDFKVMRALHSGKSWIFDWNGCCREVRSSQTWEKLEYMFSIVHNVSAFSVTQQTRERYPCSVLELPCQVGNFRALHLGRTGCVESLAPLLEGKA